jgi:hypothetical protein
MKILRAITISQPYADLIARGEKWVENRTWFCSYTGLLLIHAGKGTQYLTPEQLAEYPSGAIVAVGRMTGCANIPELRQLRQQGKLDARGCEILDHHYTEGPYGFLLADVVKFPEPIAASGKQGIWVLDRRLAETVEEVLHELGQEV